ncbi:MAG TPA: hypothetical protein VN858_05315 [Casimicrobiaceae bacterium]|nr:hypothetical protein [Casimicrobiaceae bacterium]HXU65737.1 hypothetical protein [Casimicrobiaceae bacterium]
MEPFAVLIVLPLVVGAVAERMFRDTSRASLAGALVSSLSVYACLHHLDPTGAWNGLAAFLVAPLAIAFALASVLLCFGHFEGRRAQRRPRRAWVP